MYEHAGPCFDRGSKETRHHTIGNNNNNNNHCCKPPAFVATNLDEVPVCDSETVVASCQVASRRSAALGHCAGVGAPVAARRQPGGPEGGQAGNQGGDHRKQVRRDRAESPRCIHNQGGANKGVNHRLNAQEANLPQLQQQEPRECVP